MGRRKGNPEPSGILIIDKPAGMTSHDVVAVIRGAGRLQKVGHTGTLDPFATGVLPLCLNRATRLSNLLTSGDKRYDGEIALGVTTTTQDPTGEEVERRPVPEGLTLADVRAVAEGFLGDIEQRAPAYSAIKVDGKRLYKLAREGKEVERPIRKVRVHSLAIDELEGDIVRFRVHVSKGTYIRSLAEDIGEALGCGAHLGALRRTGAGPFVISQAIPLAKARALAEEGDIGPLLLPMDAGLPDMPKVYATAEGYRRVTTGSFLRRRELDGALPALDAGQQVAIMHGAELIALGVMMDPKEGGVVRPKTVLARPPA